MVVSAVREKQPREPHVVVVRGEVQRRNARLLAQDAARSALRRATDR